MKYVDYVFDIEPGRMIFDEEITLGKIQWRPGDYFQVCEGPQGTVILRKVDPIVAFTNGLPVNENK